MDLDGYIEIPECAARMGLSNNAVIDLINARVLRAVDLGSLVLVEPAILSGSL